MKRIGSETSIYLFSVTFCLALLFAVLVAADWTGGSGPVYSAATLQSAATTGNGTALNCNNAVVETGIYVTWTSGCTGGAVTIETAPSSDYAGTWAVISTQTYSAGCTQLVQVTGAFRAIRARISSNVTGVGGSVTVVACGLR